MKEIWLDIPGYEGEYEVSNLGRVKSLKRGSEKIMKPRLGRDGYYYIGLCLGGRKSKKVHRLMCIAFIPNPKNKRTVNHIDGDKINNLISNLEWATTSENTKHAYDTGLAIPPRGERHGASKLTEEQVRKIKYEYSGYLHREIAEIYGIDRKTVSKILANQRWKHI